MDGLIRAGAWIALVFGAHAGVALSVPLYQAQERVAPWAVTVHLTERLGEAEPPVWLCREVKHQPRGCEMGTRPGDRPVPPLNACETDVATTPPPTRCLHGQIPVPPKVVKCGTVKAIEAAVAATSSGEVAARCTCCKDGCDGSFCTCRLPGVWDGPSPSLLPAEEQARIRPYDPGCCPCTAKWVGK